MYLSKRNFNFFFILCCVTHNYYLTGGCVVIVYVILLKLKQVYNMSRSQLTILLFQVPAFVQAGQLTDFGG